MMCAWEAYLSLLPLWMRNDVDKHGADTLLELRMRIGCRPKMILKNGSMHLNRESSENDIKFVISTASKYSPWSIDTLRDGYITASGGHRIGICGEVITDMGRVTGINNANMLCMRVARDFYGISRGIDVSDSSVLIIGRPGCGKTTLLRDLIRQNSEQAGNNVGVVDERCEIFPISQGRQCFEPGKNVDVISGIDKHAGVEILLRSMNPDVIAVDEITSERDCAAVLKAGWCGVKLLATAHAGNKTELIARPVYNDLIHSGLFNMLVVMHPDMSWKVERMVQECTV